MNHDGEKEFHEVMHADTTIRYQTIHSNNQFYSQLLQSLAVKNIFGLINTSMNDRGEPIVETPSEAIDFFLSLEGIDHLFINNIHIVKKTDKHPPKEATKVKVLEDSIAAIKTLLSRSGKYEAHDISVQIDLYSHQFSVFVSSSEGLLEKIVYKFSFHPSSLILLDDIQNRSMSTEISKNEKNILAILSFVFQNMCL